MVKVTVYLPKFEAPKLDRMDIIVPDMEVNFPSDFKIKSKFLSVTSKNAPLHATVSSPISPYQTCEVTLPYVSLFSHHTERRMLDLRFQCLRRPYPRELHRQGRACSQDPVWSHRREHHHDQ